MIEALRSYAEKAQSGQKLQKRLFTDDAVRGFAFIDLCQKRYDVVLMNPPFGVCSASTEQYFRSRWNSLANDIYVLFLAVFSARLVTSGCLGAITSRGFMIGRDQRDFRPLLLGKGHSSLCTLLDLGLDVLDTAAVETCAFTLAASAQHTERKDILFIDVRLQPRNSLDRLVEILPTLPRYSCTSERFLRLPQSPLIYTATDDEVASFASDSLLDPIFGKVTKGLSSSCDERFIRLTWEVTPESVGGRWKFCAKGADYQWLITNITAVIDWGDNGRSIQEYTATITDNIAQAYRSSKYYYRSGLTYTYRCNDFSLRALPEGCLFTNSAPVIIAKDKQDASSKYVALLSMFMTDRYEKLLAHVSKKGKYDTGPVGKLPMPILPESDELNNSWKECASLIFSFESSLETSPYFVACFDKQPPTIDEKNFIKHLRLFADYSGLKPSEKFILRAAKGYCDRYERDNSWPHSVLSYLLGVSFGRWDIQFANERSKKSHDSLSPFAPLPNTALGTLSTAGRVPPNTTRPDYPINPSLGGILVDDADHPSDVLKMLRSGMEYLWRDESADIEFRMSKTIEGTLQDYFRRPGNNGFWSEHIKRYTSCLRKAPIYWLLQSSKKNYAIWLYYHRLDKDLLFKALVNYVEPKIRLETSRLETLRSQKATAGDSGKEGKRLAKEAERQEDFLSELRDFEDKLRRAGNLHLEPDLNDGVVLNIAPLHELVPWKEAKNYWEELLAGKYEWSAIGQQLRQKGLVS